MLPTVNTVWSRVLITVYCVCVLFCAYCWLADGCSARAPIISCLQQQQPIYSSLSPLQPRAFYSTTSVTLCQHRQHRVCVRIFPCPCRVHLAFFLTLHAGWVYMEDQVSAFERKYTGKHSNCMCCGCDTCANPLSSGNTSLYWFLSKYRQVPLPLASCPTPRRRLSLCC